MKLAALFALLTCLALIARAADKPSAATPPRPTPPAPAVPVARVFCADEPEAKAFMERFPDMFTAGELSTSDKLYETWLTALSHKTRLPVKESPVPMDKYVESTMKPQPVAGWDGSPVQHASVIFVGGDGKPIAVLIIAASDRRIAKAHCENYLRWKFKPSIGQLELRRGIYKEVPVVALLYTRQTIALDTDKTTATPPPMQVFAKIIN